MSLSLWLPKEVGDVEEGQRSENGGKEEREIPPYFSRVSCAKILMELQLYDVRKSRHYPVLMSEVIYHRRRHTLSWSGC